MESKVCGRCKEIKELRTFSRDNHAKDKLTRWCKPCRSYAQRVYNQQRIWSIESLKNKSLYRRQWRKKYPERDYETRRRWELTHKERRRMLQQAWHVAHPNRIRTLHHKLRYNLDEQTYEALKVQQGNSCKICQKPFKTMKTAPLVDHDHNTKRIRGLLCRSCNSALGFFKDRIDILEAAMNYLRIDNQKGN